MSTQVRTGNCTARWAAWGVWALVALGIFLASGTAQAQSSTPRPDFPTTNGRVEAMVLDGNILYIGGEFTTVGGQTRNRVAAINVTTNTVTSWNPSASNQVFSLAVSGSTVYAGGNFTTIGGLTRNSIAALNNTTGAATAWNPDSNGAIYALAVSGSTVYVGGNFTTIGGQSRSDIAALNNTTGAATGWNPSATGLFGSVSALAVSGSTVYAGGSFTTIGGQSRNNIAALNNTTGAATAWNPSPSSVTSNDIRTLTVSGSTVYAGGFFTTIGAQSRNNIAALNNTTGAATAWNSNANDGVHALAVAGSTIYAGGGFFTTIGGQSRNRVAALNNTTGAATAWNPNANGGVFELAVSGSAVYAGGNFTTIGGQSRPYLAAFDLQAPAAPTSPNAASILQDRITWAWSDASSNETGFKVYADPGAGPPTTLRTTTAASVTSWTYTGLTRNTQYAFQVAATNGAGDSAKTANFAAYTLAGTPLALTLSSATTTTVNVSITAGDGNPANTQYAIQHSGTGLWVQAGGGLGASAVFQTAAVWGTKTVTGLTPATTQTFNVRARNTPGTQTGNGSSASLATLAAVPLAPTLGSATTTTVNVAITAGDTNPATTQYAILHVPSGLWVQPGGGGLFASASFQTAAVWGTKTVTGLTPATTHEFAIRARNGSGFESANGPSAQLATLAVVPLAPTLDGATGSTLDIAIAAGDGNPATTEYALRNVESGLWVQASGALGASAVYQTSAAWGTTTVTGLSELTAYSFVARARSEALIETTDSPAASASTLDASAPTVTSISPTTTGPTNVDTVDFTVTFGEAVQGFDGAADLVIAHSGTANASVSIAGGPSVYTVTVSGITGDGSFTVAVNTASDVEDLGGNPLASSVTSAAVFIDTVSPDAISITPTTTGPTNVDSVDFTVTFDEAVQGFDGAADVVIAHSGTANAGVSITGGPSVYTVTVSGITGDGSFSLAVDTASDVEDLVGNPLASSVVSAAVLIDNAGPVFSGLSVLPGSAAPGTTVAIAFEANEPLLGDPEVKVNGAVAQRVAKAAYGYSFTVAPGEALGPALIEITGFDTSGNVALLSDNAALVILDGAPNVPLGGAPIVALLLVAMAAGALRAGRRP